MELTGKAKDQFEKWLIEQNTGMVLDTESEPWVLLYDMAEAARWGFYQDWADSLSMPIETYVGDTYYYDYLIDFNPSKEGAFKTRQEARNAAIEKLNELIKQNDVISIGGFIGRTEDGIITTYERGGSDRTAADIGILFHKKYETIIDLEKDSSVVSADPKIVQDELDYVMQLSYNEARLAGMFGMKIIDPIAIKEILENGVDMPVTITDMKSPEKVTTVQRKPDDKNGHPLKIVTGKKNCAVLRNGKYSCIQFTRIVRK